MIFLTLSFENKDHAASRVPEEDQAETEQEIPAHSVAAWTDLSFVKVGAQKAVGTFVCLIGRP